jgi:hypothetical protein
MCTRVGKQPQSLCTKTMLDNLWFTHSPPPVWRRHTKTPKVRGGRLCLSRVWPWRRCRSSSPTLRRPMPLKVSAKRNPSSCCPSSQTPPACLRPSNPACRRFHSQMLPACHRASHYASSSNTQPTKQTQLNITRSLKQGLLMRFLLGGG